MSGESNVKSMTHSEPLCPYLAAANEGIRRRIFMRRYLSPMTIESGPTRCSTRVSRNPASFIHPMQSAAV